MIRRIRPQAFDPATRASRLPDPTSYHGALTVACGLAIGALACPAIAWAQTAGGVTTLPAITVPGESAGASPYAGGQVATEGRMGLLGDRDFMETPFSTVTYTEQYIEDRQARDITGVIAASDPTVFSNGVSGAWSENYAIRGFASSTTDVTLGGLYGMAPYYRTSPEMFERIEVLKGPSTLLNGMPPGGSVGGSVNLVPKRAGDTPVARATASYLSDSQFGAHVDLGRRFGAEGELGIRVNTVHRDGEGAVRGQDKRTSLGSLGVDWRGERARVSADLYRIEDRIDGVTRGISLAPGLPVPRPPAADTLLNPDWSSVRNTDEAALLRGEVDVAEAVTAYAAVGASQSDYRYNGAMSATVLNRGGDMRTSMGQLAFDTERRSGELGLRGRTRLGGTGHQWALNLTHYSDTLKEYGRRSVPGADWVTNLYRPAWGAAPAFVAPPVSHSETRLVSVGVADTMSFAGDRVQLTAGVRRQSVRTDSFNAVSGARTARYDADATSPAVALLVKASERVSLYGNYIEGLSKGQMAPVTAANAGELFPPYKTRQKEVGAKVDLGAFAHTVAWFEIERPGAYTDPATNVFSFGGEQRNRGLEWGFFGTPLPGVRLIGGVAYVDPVLTRTAGGINQGRRATGLPKWQAKLGAEWDLSALPGLTLTADATAASRQYISADNSLWEPGRTIYNVGARYATSVSGHALVLRASVNNVTDKAYWGMPLLSSLALGAPRTVQLSATMDF